MLDLVATIRILVAESPRRRRSFPLSTESRVGRAGAVSTGRLVTDGRTSRQPGAP